MASSLYSEQEFEDLDSELEILKTVASSDDASIQLATSTKSIVIKIPLRKSILFTATLPESYPYNTNKSNSKVMVISAILSNLKHTRIKTIEEFIISTNKSIDEVLAEQENSFFIVKCFTVADMCLKASEEEMINSLELLENQTVKFPLDVNQTVLKNKPAIFKSLSSSSKQTSKEPTKFKGSDFLFQRFKWDSNIDKSQIIIGYLDRFKGIQEIKFAEFKMVHDDRDGIPLHRIRYYKINDLIVWDREKKIDIITKKGDISHMFTSKEEIQVTEADKTSTELELVEEKIKNVASIYELKSNNWVESAGHEIMPTTTSFVANFKILTYNVMSRNNFKRGIQETIKYAKHSAGLDCYLENIDRMKIIIESICKTSPDFVLLQECENFEEEKLKESQFIKNTYFVSTTNKDSHCVILSKLRPVWVDALDLCSMSMKKALCAKFVFKTSSLKPKELIVCNVHLTSGKALNFFEKRKSQMIALHSYFCTQSTKNNRYNSDYTLIGGDFNFGDHELDNQPENSLIDKLFIENGFIDLIPQHDTFDPTKNFSASLTSKKLYSRRLDRVLFKSISKKNFTITDTQLFNTSPFEIHLEPHKHITYEPYTKILSSQIDPTKFYLHPSDHYGLTFCLNFLDSLHESNLVYKNTLAVVLPDYVTDKVQEIRLKHDPQFERWPPHINILYPFFELEEQNNSDQDSIIVDILNCFSKFTPFECNFKEFGTFARIVYLKPDYEATTRLKQIYTAIISSLFMHVNSGRWKKELVPHCTIAQLVDKRVVRSSGWLEKTLATIKEENPLPFPGLKFDIDCIHWLQRKSDNDPFKIKFSFPLGERLPCTIRGLNPINFTKPAKNSNILKFLYDKNMISTIESDVQLNKLNQNIFNTILKNSDEFKLFNCGSYQLGIKCNDFDFSLVRNANQSLENRDFFVQNLVHNLAQNTDQFHIVRNCPAAVPIIELQLTNETITNADLQINELTYKYFKELNSISGNHVYEYLLGMSSILEYRELVTISGIFESVNLIKYVPAYKDFQVLLTFVKFWAKSRNVYGQAFGYLSGCSWTLMVAYFLLKNDFENRFVVNTSSEHFAELVRRFFNFFASFNWNHPVCLLDLDHVTKKSGQFQVKRPIIVLQSVFPYHNTARNVQDQFKKIIISELCYARDSFEKECSFELICKPVDASKFSRYLKFNFLVKNPNSIGHLKMLVKANIQGLVNNIRSVFGGEVRPFCDLSEPIYDETKYLSSYLIGLGPGENFKRCDIEFNCYNFIRNIKNLSHISEFDIELETNFD